jgi:Arm DNA-binding domain/Phage integrase, N-terminal SAM-like domain
MAKVKLTKTAVEAATFGAKAYELRDAVVPGFLLKVTPAGRKIFMVQYRTNAGERRKPAIGRFGEFTVEQARSIAQDWLADVRKGKDPSAEKRAARGAPSVKELCAKFMEDYSKPKNRPRTVESNQGYIDRHIIPKLGTLKVRETTRSDVSSLITRMKKTPVTANRVLSCLRKMFNMAEVWGFRDDGTNPCRHIPKYPESGKTRLITDDEMARLFGYLDRADVEGLEHPFLTLGVSLQFAFAARMHGMGVGRLCKSSRRLVGQQDRRNLEANERGRRCAAFERTAPGRFALRRAFHLQTRATDVPDHLL